MTTFLLSGCAGFLASHFIEYILHQNHNAIGIDNGSTQNIVESSLSSPQFKLIKGDILSSDFYKSIRSLDFDVAVHFAGMHGEKYFSEELARDSVNVNVEGANLFSHYCKIKNARFVHIFPISVEMHPELQTSQSINLYLQSKKEAEKIVERNMRKNFANARVYDTFGERHEGTEYWTMINRVYNGAIENNYAPSSVIRALPVAEVSEMLYNVAVSRFTYRSINITSSKKISLAAFIAKYSKTSVLPDGKTRLPESPLKI